MRPRRFCVLPGTASRTIPSSTWWWTTSWWKNWWWGGSGPFCVGKRETGKCWGCVRLVFYSHVFLMLLVGLELEKKMSQEPTPPHNFEHQSVWFTRMDYHQLSTCMTLSEQSCNSGCISHHGRADRLEIFGWTRVPVNGGDQFPTEEFFKSHDILSRWERQ